MLIEFKLKKLPGNANQGKVGKIYKKNGDTITVGETLLDIESNKGSTPVKSDLTGIIQEIKVTEGATVNKDDILAVIDGEQQEGKTKNTLPKFDYLSNMLKPQKQELESDIAIIGGGPGGYIAAIQAAKLGAQVILIEKEKIGGTCLNRGCIPTKAFVRSTNVYHNLKNAAAYGLHADNISADIKKIVDRKNNIVNQLNQGIRYLLDKNNIKFLEGFGEILDNETIFVKNKRYETTIKTKNIIIATGSVTSKLAIPGNESQNVITSTEALDLEMLPHKMIIVGGGIIGMEFAFIFANLGVDITVIEFLDDILAILDKDVCEEITQAAKNLGIKLYTGSKVRSIIETEDRQSIVSFEKDNELKFVSADKVLMAVGRQPCLDGIPIEKLDIELNENKKGIKVNDKMQTNISNIYAIGDVTNKMQLAHIASQQGVVAVKNILNQNTVMDYKAVPSAIFTDPEIAVIGINEKEAKELGIDIEIGKFPFAANGKALTLGESRGFVKIIKEKSTGKIIGSSIIGPHATDLIAEITLAIKNGLTAGDIIETIHAHPTTAESIHEAALSVEGGAFHFAE